jgi:hypothetical protein
LGVLAVLFPALMPPALDDVSYAANSQFVAKRVADAWGVNAALIYPPVDIDRIVTSVVGFPTWTARPFALYRGSSCWVRHASFRTES